MPHIQITLFAGRTPEQKRKVVERITQAMMDEIGASRDSVTITMVEIPKSNLGKSGVLAIDQQ
jgi:4-oxalocrotonate tautomerase